MQLSFVIISPEARLIKATKTQVFTESARNRKANERKDFKEKEDDGRECKF